MPSTLEFSSTLSLKAPPERLWNFLAHTDRINRTVGLPAVQFASRPIEAGSTILRAQAKVLGFSLAWDEYPFEWVENRYYHVTRRFLNGPIDEVHAGIKLEPENGNTRVRIFARMKPRNAFGSLLARLFVGRKSLRDLETIVRRIDQYLDGASAHPFTSKPTAAAADIASLQSRASELQRAWPGESRLVDGLVTHLQEAHDDEVVGMRPFELADRWEAERLEALKLFLYATRAGMLDLSWTVLCPTCRVVKARHDTLRDLKSSLHCDTCRIAYDANFDQNVELRFNVNPSIRRAEEVTYCVGGPMNTPHRIAQFYLMPGETREANVHLRLDRLRFRSYEVSPAAEVRVRQTASERELCLVCTEQGFAPREIDVSPGDSEVVLENRTDQPVLAILEPEEWRERGATAALVSSLQEFRDMFSSEVLAPGEEVGIRSLAFMFTDLKGSTSMYEGIGDAPAYGLVRSHFEFLKEHVNRHNGAIVKTIGDAVMAVFVSGREALQCALEIQRDVKEFNSARGVSPDITIKLGLHEGPVVAVNANDRLDYFGTTVNVAARVQAESMGHDVVLTDSLYCSADAETLIRKFGLRAEPFSVELRGLSQHFALKRLR